MGAFGGHDRRERRWTGLDRLESLVGRYASDEVGRLVTGLTNGHYVVSSFNSRNYPTQTVGCGVVTWCNGAAWCGPASRFVRAGACGIVTGMDW